VSSQYQELLETQKRKLKKAIEHLEYSYQKVLKLSEDAALLDEEGLETWESFAARFARVTELFLVQYLRTCVLITDPGFSGSLRDFINQGEKLHFIDNAQSWLAIRELRNITAHDYSEKDLTAFFRRLKQECPRLLQIKL
jgi:hypothetical protein